MADEIVYNSLITTIANREKVANTTQCGIFAAIVFEKLTDEDPDTATFTKQNVGYNHLQLLIMKLSPFGNFLIIGFSRTITI